MGIRVSGLSVPAFGLQWQTTPGDKDAARRVLCFLEDRRLLFGTRHVEDEIHCIRSAIEIRRFLTQQLDSAKPGNDLSNSIRTMRAACRKFVDAAGPDGRDFIQHDRYGVDPFSIALGDLRTTMGMHIALLSHIFDLEIEDDLASILPPDPRDDDGRNEWLPGHWR